jgi:hypothetical protein
MQERIARQRQELAKTDLGPAPTFDVNSLVDRMKSERDEVARLRALHERDEVRILRLRILRLSHSND